MRRFGPRLLLAAPLLSGCFPVTAAPRIVRVSELLGPAQDYQPRETLFPVVMGRFIDQRASRNILGQYDVGGRGGFLGTVTLAADGDITTAFESLVKRDLERKGIPAGQSIFVLNGTIKRANVGARPDSQTLTADIAIQLTVTDSNSGAVMWQKSFQGAAVGSDPQATLALAFRDMEVALERDDSLTPLRKNFLELGGKVPEGAASARPQIAARGPAAQRPVYSSDVDRPVFSTPQNPDRFAVIVGVERYSAGLPDAQFAERDADAVRENFIAIGIPPRNIKTLVGAEATKSNLEAYLQDWLPRNVTPGSQVFFYFSGHGAPDPSSGQAFLVPWDGNPNFLEKTAYPLKRLYKDLGSLKVARVIVALDSCFSGAGGRSVLAEGTRPLVTRVDASDADNRVVLLAATSSQEVTSTLKDQGHGIFTYYLLKGLAGDARRSSGAVTVRGLYDYFKPKVQDAASLQGREQTPLLQGVRPGEDIQLR